MREESESTGGPGRTLHHALPVAAVAAGELAAVRILVEFARQGRHLHWRWGPVWWPVVVGLGLGCVLGLALVARLVRDWRRGTWTSTSLAPFRNLFSTGVLAAAVCLAFLQPYEMLRSAAAFGLAWGAFALGWLALPRIRRVLPARALRAADFVVFNLCLVAFVLESGLRVYANVRPSLIFQQRDTPDALWVRTYWCPPRTVHLGYPCNRNGHYDTNVAPDGFDGTLVASVGDSFSYSAVPYRFHFTTVAEGLLEDTEVYNVGIAGAGPPQYLYLLETEVLPLGPDAIVVNLFLGNDVVFPETAGAAQTTMALWLDRENLLLYLVPKRLARWRAEQDARGAGGNFMEKLERKARRALRDSSSREKIVAQMPWLEDPLLEEPHFSEESFLELERERMLDACRVEGADYSELFTWLDAIVAAAGEIPIGFVLIPDEFQVEDWLWDAITDGVPEEVDRTQPQRLVTDWLEAQGVPVLDLLPILRAQEPLADGRLHVYHLRDTHFNARGNRIAGEQLAAFARSLLDG